MIKVDSDAIIEAYEGLELGKRTAMTREKAQKWAIAASLAADIYEVRAKGCKHLCVDSAVEAFANLLVVMGEPVVVETNFVRCNRFPQQEDNEADG